MGRATERAPYVEELQEKIRRKIDYVLAGINNSTDRRTDLLVAQTVQALTEAHKNLEAR